MPRRIPEDVRRRVLELWVEGCSYRRIHRETGVSLGCISSIVRRAKAENPTAAELRRLKAILEVYGVSYLEAVRGASLASKLNSLGLSLEDLDRYVKVLERIEGDAPTILDYAYRLSKLEADYGLTYEQIVESYKARLEEAARLGEEVSSLEKSRGRLLGEVRELQTLRRLQAKLDAYGLTPDSLEDFIAKSVKLGELGFDLDTALVLAGELSRLGSPVESAAKTAVDLILERGGLKDAVEELRREKERLEGELEDRRGKLRQVEEERDRVEAEVSKLREERRTLSEKVRSLRRRLGELESSIEELRGVEAGLRSDVEYLESKIREIAERMGEFKPFHILSLVTRNPIENLPVALLLETYMANLQALKRYVMLHKKEFSEPELLIWRIDKLIWSLEDEVRVAAWRFEEVG